MPGMRDDSGRPFVLTIVADFADTGSKPRAEPLPIHPGGMQETFAALRPRLDLRTPDRLTGAIRGVLWAPEFSSLRDFDPAALLQRFPPAIPLLAWRKRLVEATRAGSGNAGLLDALDSLWPDIPVLSPARPAADANTRASGAGQVDALLDLLETPEAPGAPPAGPSSVLGLRERIQSLLSLSGSPEGRLRQALTAVDEALGRQIEAILRDRRLRDLEAAWLSLRSIVETADLRRGDFRIDILPATRAEAPEALAALAQSRVAGWARPSAGEAFLVDHAIGPDDASSAILGSAILLASAATGRLFLPLDPDLLGEGGDGAAARPGPVSRLAGSEALAALRALAAEVGGGRIVLTCNRSLYRAPYVPEDNPVSIGAFRESAAGPDGPYANAVWLAGRAIAEAVRRDGPAAAEALEAPIVRSVPLRPLGPGDEPEHLVPLEFLLGVPEARQLIDAGLAVLTCDRDRDEVVLRGLKPPAAGAEAPAAGPGEAKEGLSSHLSIHLPSSSEKEETIP